MPTLCLNGIVKNEGKIIKRLLDSVVGVVDEYVLVDTGSTDDTITQIETHELPGTIIRTTFEDFAVTRTFALAQARLHSKCDYLLLLDADMRLVDRSNNGLRMLMQCTADVAKANGATTPDAWTMIQEQGGLHYRNTRIVRRTLDARYVGATHEYLDLPSGSSVREIDRDITYINDLGDGGCKSDKFERDRRLLEGTLAKDPGNERALFYLAQTCHALGENREALTLYLQRILRGGFEQEVDYARLQVLDCHLKLNEYRFAEAWLDDIMEPKGSKHVQEGAYRLCKYHREAGRHDKAMYFYLRACRAHTPVAGEVLFHDASVSDHLLEFELSVLAYYLRLNNHLDVGLQSSCRLLSNPNLPWCLRNTVRNNMLFYITALPEGEIVSLDDKPEVSVVLDEGGWHASTPSFVTSTRKKEDVPMVVVRIVSYSIRPNGGGYDLGPTGLVNTRNVLLGRGEIKNIVDDALLPYRRTDGLVKSFEDLRLILDPDDIYMVHVLAASLEYTLAHNTVSQVYGRLDLGTMELRFTKLLRGPGVTDGADHHEKNWVFTGPDTIIYDWWPAITVARLPSPDNTKQGECLSVVRKIESPRLFEGMRGSSNGVFYGGCWWFVTHSAVDKSGETRRYLHYLVVLEGDIHDPDAKIGIRYTAPFVFEKQDDPRVIQFCNALSITGKGVEFGYSLADGCSRCRLLVWPDVYGLQWSTAA